MPHTDSITKIKICHSLYQNKVSTEKIYKQLGIHRATMYRWLKQIKIKGINKFIKDYKKAKRGKEPRESIQTDTVDFGSIYAFTAIGYLHKRSKCNHKRKINS